MNTATEIIDATVIDTSDGSVKGGRNIYILGDQIVSITDGDRPADFPASAEIINGRGKYVIPGLIDAHVHVLGYQTDLGAAGRESPLYVAGRAVDLMGRMLDRGFTTVRDVGGADHGLVRAVEEGLFEGPRLFHGGPALSQTGGHGDFRSAGSSCAHSVIDKPVVGTVCDGSAAVRAAVRNEIRRGAKHIKMMLGGGIASPTDRINSNQFSVDEIAAAVEEAENANIYVTGHAYTPRSMRRALELGVKCIEHGNLLDEETAQAFVERGAFLVPTLAIGALLASEESAEYGVDSEGRAKAAQAVVAGANMLQIAKSAGVQLVFGTDFIGGMQKFQSREFAVRAEVLSPLDVLQSATVTAAKLLGEEDRLGQVKTGFAADLLVLSDNPLNDIAVLSRPESTVTTVISRGRIVRQSERR